MEILRDVGEGKERVAMRCGGVVRYNGGWVLEGVVDIDACVYSQH